MDLWLRLAGTVLIGIALLDIFLTVLYARSGAGFMAPVLAKGVWYLFRELSRLLGERASAFLSFAGPLILILIAAGWLLLLVFGFAFLYWPELGSGLTKSVGPTPTDFVTALYYSGFCLTTLGIGDIAPTSGGIRLLTVVEAAFGFSFFTLTITYFLSIYSALQRRSALASILHHKTSGTGDARRFLIPLGAAGADVQASQDFADLAARTADLEEAHTFYPVLHYFHFHHRRYALPRIALILLDTASLAKTLPLSGKEKFQSSAAQLETATRDLLERMAEVFLTRRQVKEYGPAAQMIDDWRLHYRETLRALRAAGTKLSGADEEERYITLRRQWHPYLAAFAASLKYDLDRVVPPWKLP